MNGKDNSTSWLVISVVTFSAFLEVGIVKGFGILLPDLKEQLDTQTWIIGSSISIIIAFGYLLGLLSDVLVRTFSPRTCVMMSGLIASLGLAICSIASSSGTLLVGVVLSGPLLLQETILFGVIPQYFDRYYEAAVGLAACGTGLGITIMPILTQLLLDRYGWRGALLLLGTIAFHSVPCGALVKLPTHNDHDRGQYKTIKSESTSHQTSKQILRNIYDILGVHLLHDIAFISRVLVPGLVWGYLITGWMIYMVSFAVSIGVTLNQASIVATSGGIGIVAIRLVIPLMHKVMTYKQLLYVSSITSAVALSITTQFGTYVTLNIMSFMFGLSIGTIGGELLIAAKVNCDESDHYLAIGWLNVSYGAASILSGVITGLFFDLTGSFTISFNILAAVSLIIPVSLGLDDYIWSK